MPGPTAVASMDLASTSPASRLDVTTERKLLEYLADFQAQTAMAGKSAQLGNPAALAGETMRRLQGFIERQGSLDKVMSKKVQKMNQGETEKYASLTSDDVQQGRVHGGPAREALLPTERVERSEHSAKSVSAEEMQKALDGLLKVAMISTEGLVASGAAGSVSRSVNSLLRGQ